MSIISILTIIGCFIYNSFSVQEIPQDSTRLPKDPPFLSVGEEWADSIMNTMSLDEKIGQLFMVAAYSNKDQAHVNQIESLIKNQHIGGLIFMQGGPHRQAILLNHYQEISKIPLLIGMDAEWSLSMRLDSVVLYPRQMMIAAANNEELIYDMGKEFARQLKRVGVHVSFSPDVDVNNNPLNPVINTRAFGENPEKVAKFGWMYAKGLQDNNVLAVAKHFPGHGDTNVDSHKDLPIITHNRARLDSVEFFPFRYCIRKGVGGVMISHLYLPELDSTPNLPTTLSKKVVNDLLKNEMGFKGLVFTDAMNMQGVTKFFKPGDAEFKALLAGNDILLFAGNVPYAIKLIKSAIEKGEISEEEINIRVKKILQTKYWAGLNNYQPIDLVNLTQDLNSPEAKLMQQKLIESSITLVRNTDNLIPLSCHDSIKIASVGIGVSYKTNFQTRMSYYAKINQFIYSSDFASLSKEKVLEKLLNYDVIIFGFHKASANPSENYGINQSQIWLINELSKQKKVIIDIFGTPYALAAFENCNDLQGIIVSHNDWKLTQDFSAQLIFGGIGTDARLPVSAGKVFKEGMGVSTKANKLKYSSVPEEAGIDSKMIKSFDSVALSGITNRAYPGCQIVVARKGIVFYNKSFGYHTYDNKNVVSDFDIYDMASVTKVMATTLCVMKLYENGSLNLDDNFSKYLPEMEKTDKKNINIKDAMMHQAGFTPWIPYYKKTISSDSIRASYYSKIKDDTFSIQVAENMYMRNDYRDSIFFEINNSELGVKKRYKYSDLGFILTGEVIKKISGKTLDELAYEFFYSKIGANRTCFNPLKYFNRSEIAPTEDDIIFRKQLIWGYVHDQASAMLGGVAGHAGLFSTANDIAKLAQMLLNKGEYGGIRYLNSETVELFTKYDNNYPDNRRGIGFDKQLKTKNGKGPVCDEASQSSYGHSGFTGTYVWIDPAEELIYVFVCNRVYPNAENNKILSLGIRTNLHQLIYKSIIKDNYIKNAV